MHMFIRILVGLIGLLATFTAAQHWFALKTVAAERGIVALEASGRANVRADVGGLFLAIGIFSILAAWKQSRTWAVAALVATGAAFLGRLISFVMDGNAPGVVAPLVIELIFIALFAWAAWSWTKMPEGL